MNRVAYAFGLLAAAFAGLAIGVSLTLWLAGPFTLTERLTTAWLGPANAAYTAGLVGFGVAVIGALTADYYGRLHA